jgi:tetratricopeptide (TPR) repeat protein
MSILLCTQVNTLASVLESLDQYDEAEDLFREALRVKKLQLGGDHTSTGITMDRLALLLEKTEQFEEAEELYRGVLTIKINTFGEVTQEW